MKALILAAVLGTRLRTAVTNSIPKALATLVVRDRLTSRYLLFDQTMQLCGWENRKTGEILNCRDEKEIIPLAFSGIQVIDPEIFSLITATNHPVRGYLDDASYWKDVGKLE